MERKKLKTPTIRFKEFTKEWELRKIGEYITDYKEVADENLPLYSLTIQNGVVPKSERYERSFLVKGDKADAYKVMNKGDFAFNPMNLRFGALAMHKEEKRVAVSRYYDIFRCNDNAVPEFLEAYLTTYNMIQFYDKMSTGTLEEKKRVHYLDFIHFRKPFPTLPEQKKIADFLSAVDARIQHLNRKKELLERYKKGVMQKLFPSTGSGQTPELRFKRPDGANYPDWEAKRLGDVAEVQGGGTPDTTKPEYWDGGIPWYTPTEIVSRLTNGSKRTISDLGLKKSSASLLPIGTILFTSRATIGAMSFASEECTTNQGFMSLMANAKATNEYLYYWILKNQKQFIRRSQGSTFLEISKKEMKKVLVDTPCVEEQQKIADFLSALDKKIEAVSTQIAKTQQFKKGLLQKMFV